MKVVCRIKSGALSLGSLGICLIPDQEVNLSEEQLNNLDVKEAVQHNLLEIDGEVNFDKTFILTNVSGSILSFNSINAALPPGESALVYSSNLTYDDIAEALYFEMVTVTPYHVPEEVVIEPSSEDTDESPQEDTKAEDKEKPKRKRRKKKSTKVLVKQKKSREKSTTGKKRGRPRKDEKSLNAFGDTDPIQDIIKEKADE